MHTDYKKITLTLVHMLKRYFNLVVYGQVKFSMVNLRQLGFMGRLPTLINVCVKLLSSSLHKNNGHVWINNFFLTTTESPYQHKVCQK